MLKRIYALLMALALSLSLTACSEEVTNAIVDEVADAVIEEMVDVLTEEDSASVPATGSTGEAAQESTQKDTDSTVEEEPAIAEDGTYTTAEDVALYIHTYGRLPRNFMTKKEARNLGWEGGSLEKYAPGMCIGGDYFGNYEGLLPEEDGREYTECDIDTLGASGRGAKRIVFSNDGLIYYTEDHYEHFTLLYGEE